MAKKSDAAPASNPSPPVVGGNVLSEYASYARPQDFGTTPEILKLMLASGVQSPMTVFPNPDPDGDGDPRDGGTCGVLDFKC